MGLAEFPVAITQPRTFMATLREFLLDLAKDPTLVDKLQADPNGVMDAHGLSEDVRTALRSRDAGALRTALGGNTEGFGISVTVHIQDPVIKVTVVIAPKVTVVAVF